MTVHCLVGIADLGQALWHGSEREIARIARLDVFPLQWSRDARVRSGPHRVGAGDRPILRVLVVVQKHTVPFFFPPFARRQIGRASLDFACQRQRGTPYFSERPAALDAHVHVHTSRPGRLGPADQSDVVQRCAHDTGDLPYLRPLHAWDRIEIDAQLVWMIEVVRAHWMRVQLQTREVGHPCERRRITRHDFLGASA